MTLATPRMNPSRILMMAALAAAQAAAQQPTVPPAVDPGAIQRRQMEEEQRRRQEEQERQKPTEPINRDALKAPVRAPADNTVKFLVREITFSPSKILSSSELEQAAAEFRGKEVTLAELQQLTAHIDAAYQARHIVTAEAIIPPQDVSQGVVHVRLIEGRIGRTTVSGNTSTRTRYIEGRLRLEPEALVDLDRLESAMVRFNRTNDAQVRASLKPGAETGTTDFQIDVTEPRRDDLRLTLDDLGSPPTGRTRLTAAYLHHSLFGCNDDFSLSDTKAQGQNSTAVGYGFPVNTWGGRLDLGFNFDKTAIKNGGLQPLDITGESRGWTVSLRQPTLLNQRLQLDVIAGAQKRDSANWIDTEFLNDTRTRSKSLGLELQVFGDQDYGFASWTRSWCTATVLAPVKLIIDRGSMRYNHDFGQGYSLNSSFTWQAAPQRPLPSSEQFFIGGDGSVAGYTVAVLSGYNGQVVDLELHHPLGVWSPGQHKITTTGVLTLDYGSVTPYLPPDSGLPAHDHLTGIGWGVNAAIGKRINARASYGYGFTKVPSNQRDRIVIFQIVTSLF